MKPLQLINKSLSGSTIIMNSIYVEPTSAKCYSSLLLLTNMYKELDPDEIEKRERRFRLIELSRGFLSEVLKREGHLKCTYCPKDNLQIEFDGMKVTRNIMATIDHIVPISKGGAIYDYENLCVSCSKCNGKKGDKDLQTFLNKRNENNNSKGKKLCQSC
jgi:5-methylcytosine-specific restriction endonuclease McrA